MAARKRGAKKSAKEASPTEEVQNAEKAVADKVAAHAKKTGKAVYDLSAGESLPGPDSE